MLIIYYKLKTVQKSEDWLNYTPKYTTLVQTAHSSIVESHCLVVLETEPRALYMLNIQSAGTAPQVLRATFEVK